jgi:HlyD family secretion protein
LNKFISGKVIKYAVIVLVIALIASGGYYGYSKMTAAGVSTIIREATAQVVRGELAVTISGTGTVQPISIYEIVPLVKGNIIEAPFEEGDQVKEGDLLYRIDDSDLSYNIQKAQNNIEKMKINNEATVESLKDLVIYAPCDGRLTEFSFKKGDEVNSNEKIADVINDKQIIAKVPFHEPQAKKISIGQKAQLAITDNMWYIDGEVTDISSTPRPVAGGGPVYDVEITIDNPGAFSEGMEVTGIIKAPDGDLHGTSKATTEYVDNESVLAKTSGNVKEVYVKNGEWVKKGQRILELENNSIHNTIYKNSLDLEDSKLSLEAQKKQLNDYYIVSPIDGTVIQKDYKLGDTVNSGNNSTKLMTIADMSKMVFTIEVDELDIAKIAEGQKVDVTADALPNEKFEGEVTKVSVLGNTQNGVTTYPVEVTISTPGKLRPGMNVNAKIMVESKKDVLYVPMSAVTMAGDKAFVRVKSDGDAAPKRGNDGQQPGERFNSPKNVQQNAVLGSAKDLGQQGAAQDGRQLREVVVGINNEDYIEIISGISEGEIVYLPSVSAGSLQTGRMQGGMGFPGGGMGGSRPGGVVRIR